MEEQDRVQLAQLRESILHILSSVDEIKEQIKSLGITHTTRETFEALRDRVALMEKIVFGALGVVLITVLGAIIALVIRK